jgi:hypothetical protein
MTYSKNNNGLHPSIREYFDRPVNHIYKGYLFSPKHKFPLELYHNGKSHYNVKEKLSERYFRSNNF